MDRGYPHTLIEELLFEPMSITSNSLGPTTPIHLSLLHSKQQVMHTSSAFAKNNKRLEEFACEHYTIKLNSLFEKKR